jgi:predicted acylesterase/phospholipase RssA
MRHDGAVRRFDRTRARVHDRRREERAGKQGGMIFGLKRTTRRERQIRVLAIDSGGIRGMIPAMVLAELERRTGRHAFELFDLIVGVSTGAIVALGLTAPRTPGGAPIRARDVVSLYQREGPSVFGRSWVHALLALGNLRIQKYPADGLEDMLGRYFADVRLKDCLTDVIVPVYEIERRRPFHFRSSEARVRTDSDYAMTRVLRAATAAPTYFEPAQVPNPRHNDHYTLIDGAVFAANPAMLAYGEALELFPDASEVLLLSLGTGELTRRLAYEDVRSWGAPHWARQLFNIMMDGNTQSVHQQMTKVLPPDEKGRRRYYRLQLRLDVGNDEMDDTSEANYRVLRLLTDDLIRDHDGDLAELAERLLEVEHLRSAG